MFWCKGSGLNTSMDCASEELDTSECRRELMGMPGSSAGKMLTADRLPFTRIAWNDMDRDWPTAVVYKQQPLQTGRVHWEAPEQARAMNSATARETSAAARISSNGFTERWP